ncbi:DNA/RNA non-specific endonuclease [Caldimonas brevitalea]|uniref:Endonuclease G, mitochondrial n=1 Tax=Caldimonas brevitalea TaxID=413882 RepID=A0A0G3BFF6_9BURK|nr:DNA/RNA non-specific endonuclease [Caldimonas brevitalea]AKJ28184.1 endonuclease G, mitochondrial [Caldimonas brevitalea]
MTGSDHSDEDLRQRTLLSILDDKEMRYELQRRAADHELGSRWDVDAGTLASLLEDPRGAVAFESRPLSEAIVRAVARPVLMIENHKVTLPNSDVLSRRIGKFAPVFEPTLRSVGRVELVGHPALEWVGTGWMVEEGIVVTNRHVASEFARRDATGKGYVFIRSQLGTEVLPRIDFHEEYRSVVAAEFRIERVLYIAPHSETAPDVAFLKVVPGETAGLPTPIEPVADLRKHLRERRFMAVVGYPARDSRSDSRLMDRIFGDVYDVKRFSPGEVMTVHKDNWFFEHDATTLGGNSGSVILDLQTGKALGLHYAGAHRKANFAVRIDTVLEMLHIAKGRTTVGGTLAGVEWQEKTRPVDSYTATGYDERFLGVRVPLPKPGRAADLLPVNEEKDAWRLDYTHFSVRMSASRRLPLLTAVNIDGSERRKLSRKGQVWFFDPRIEREQQVGKEFYGPSGFDRGHMVRREDPVWGTPEEAARANEDTFHYTNAAPQLPGLNQREWLELEDYVLDNADALDLKVSVFTGPVFAPGDPVMHEVQVPLRFWKVAVLVDAGSGELSCAAYLLSQEDMLAEAFHYGRFKTYQVPLTHLEELTGINFGKALRDADGYTGRGGHESVPKWSPGIEIRCPEDVQFPRRARRKRR